VRTRTLVGRAGQGARLADQRAAPTASTGAPRRPGPTAKASSGSTRSTLERRRRFSPNENAPRSPGPRLRGVSRAVVCPTTCTNSPARSAPKRNWPISRWRSRPSTDGTGWPLLFAPCPGRPAPRTSETDRERRSRLRERPRPRSADVHRDNRAARGRVGGHTTADGQVLISLCGRGFKFEVQF
jgi:hypothetical protein